MKAWPLRLHSCVPRTAPVTSGWLPRNQEPGRTPALATTHNAAMLPRQPLRTNVLWKQVFSRDRFKRDPLPFKRTDGSSHEAEPHHSAYAKHDSVDNNSMESLERGHLFPELCSEPGQAWPRCLGKRVFRSRPGSQLRVSPFPSPSSPGAVVPSANVRGLLPHPRPGRRMARGACQAQPPGHPLPGLANAPKAPSPCARGCSFQGM